MQHHTIPYTKGFVVAFDTVIRVVPGEMVKYPLWHRPPRWRV